MQAKNQHKLSDLLPGESAVLSGFDESFLHKERFSDLGFTKGTPVSLIRKAPFGDPIQIQLRGKSYALRLKEAASICIEKGLL